MKRLIMTLAVVTFAAGGLALHAMPALADEHGHQTSNTSGYTINTVAANGYYHTYHVSTNGCGKSKNFEGYGAYVGTGGFGGSPVFYEAIRGTLTNDQLTYTAYYLNGSHYSYTVHATVTPGGAFTGTGTDSKGQTFPVSGTITPSTSTNGKCGDNGDEDNGDQGNGDQDNGQGDD